MDFLYLFLVFLHMLGLAGIIAGFLMQLMTENIKATKVLLHSALLQFLKDVDWGELDFLLLDLPPGTGDVALTLSQRVRSTGAVLVTTPQEVALQDVYKSESDTNQRNQAIGALMLAYGYIKDNWQQAVDLYTRQCSIGVNAQDLATMAATLAFGGTNPVTKKPVMDAAKVPGVLAVMATAGLYDDSGKWLYHTGLPAKSGVGGGIIAVSPGKFGIAVVSPPLDDAGNSIRAQRAIADISNALGGNPLMAKAHAR